MVGSGVVYHATRGSRMGTAPSHCSKGYPCFRVPTVAPGPTCRLVSSTEVGLEATVDTLKQGYPLLQYEDTIPTRLSLVVW